MAITENTYTGNGSTTNYSFTFPYLEETDIKVTLNSVITTAYTLANATTLSFTTAPANGVAIRIYRETSDATAKAVFYPGSAIRAQDLNDNFNQVLYSTQETIDRRVDATGGTMTGNLEFAAGKGIIFEGTTNDANETTLLGGDPTADRTLNLPNSSGTLVSTGDVGSVATAMIADSNVTTAKIADSNVTTTKIADANVTTAKLADGSVTSAKIADGTIVSNDLANDAVITTKILDANITTAKIADQNVTTAKIADLNVTTGKLADGAVTDAKVASGIDGAKLTAGTVDSSKLTGATVVTNAEVAGVSPNDTSFYTTSASDLRYFRQDSSETINSGMAWSGSDSFIATTAAIDARIIDLVDDVGGFVPIANETSFPVTNPDINNPDGAGTIVSIKEMTTTRTPVSGTVTIASGAGGNTVTINGCGSTVLAAGFGVLVETTSTLHTYTFHRLVPKATEVTTVAGIAGNVTTVAGISSNVTTVAGISSNVTTVASNISDIQTVANDLNEPVSEIDTVATNIANVNTVGNAITNVNTVATNISDIQTVAADLNEPVSEIDTVATNIANVNNVGNNIANVNTVATNDANVTTVAGSIANVNTNATNIANINTVAGINANVTSVAGNSANINTVAGSIANVNTAAGSIANVNTVAGSIANVNTVGTNIANVINASNYLNNFLGLYLGSLSSDPSVDTFGNPVNTGDNYFNSVSSQWRVFNGSSWQSLAENQFTEFVPLTGNFNTIYTGAVGSNLIDLGDLAITGAVFPGENVPAKRVALATGSSSYNFGNL